MLYYVRIGHRMSYKQDARVIGQPEWMPEHYITIDEYNADCPIKPPKLLLGQYAVDYRHPVAGEEAYYVQANSTEHVLEVLGINKETRNA